MKKYVFLIFSILTSFTQAQEFKCNVKVDASGISTSNKEMFKTLERSISEFVNKNRWTDKQFKAHERIKCDIIVNIKDYDQKTNVVKSELYFRSYRPVFKSDYETLLLNLVEKSFQFKYQEFQKLDFNIELYDNNLVSSIAYYLYVALGHDFDSFKENTGKEFYEKAQIIQNNANQNSVDGWDNDGKNNSKGDLIDLLLNEQNKFYHKAIYTYNRWGLDMMSEKLALGKNNIITAINYIKKLRDENKDADYLIKIFFDAKSDEIVQIYTSGPPVNKNYIVSKLRDLAPNYDFKWDEIQKGSAQGFGRQGPPGKNSNFKDIERKSIEKNKKEQKF